MRSTAVFMIWRIVLVLVLLCASFYCGTSSYYTQLEIGKAIIIGNDPLKPEQWNKLIAEARYQVVGYHNAWKWPWESKCIDYIEGVVLIPEWDSESSVKTILMFDSGVFEVSEEIRIRGFYSIQGQGYNTKIVIVPTLEELK